MMSASTIFGEIGLQTPRPERNSSLRGASALVVLLAVLLPVTALALIGWAESTTHWQSAAAVRSAVIVLLAAVYLELSLRIARTRRSAASGRRVTMVAVWAIAALLCLPTGYVALIVPLLLGYELLRAGSGRALYRASYAAAVLTVATIAGQRTFQALEPTTDSSYGGRLALAVALAVAAFLVIGVLFDLLMNLATGESDSWRHLVAEADERAVLLATAALGILAGILVAQTVVLAPVVLVVLVVLERSALVSQLQVAATTDAKTGLLNAAAWQELSQRQLLRSQRAQRPGAVLLLDLDHFKRLNDTLGHLRGDLALKAVADALRRELRGYDAVARFGGEEFVVFLNELALEDATVVAERVLTRIRNLSIAGADPTADRYLLTASIGLAGYPDDGTDLAALLEAADRALYGAKDAGRDRVGLSAGLPPTSGPGPQQAAGSPPVRSRTREAS